MPPHPIREFAEETEPKVRGFLHSPETPNGSGMVLTHGAGSHARAPLLIALAETFCATGLTVLRCDLPYRQMRSWGPPGPSDAARDRAGLKNAIVCVKKIVGAPLLPDVGTSGDFHHAEHNASVKLYLGGHSYGGRQSSMLCAEEPELVSGLLLLSYPLHPPRKPEQMRTQHLPDLRTPTLFVQGTRDPFGSVPEFEQALKMIPGKTKLLRVEGAGHDLGFKGKARKEELPALVLEEFTKLLSRSS